MEIRKFSETKNNLVGDLAYILGALRDGGIGIYKGKRKKDYRTYISQYKDYSDEWLEIVKKMLLRVFKKHVTIVKGFLSISSKEVFYFLHNECGVQPNKKEWKTPRWIFYSTKKVRKTYIRGFLDADGSIPIRDSGRIEIQISQKQKEVLKELKQILSEFDINSSVCKSRNIFKLNIGSKPSIINFFKKIGSFHPNHQRKIKRALAILGRKLDSTPEMLPGATA